MNEKLLKEKWIWDINKKRGDILKHVHYTDVELEEPNEQGLKDVKVRWLISEKEGAKNFAMRLFEIKPGCYTPLHQHPWEHEVFIKEGSGILVVEKKEIRILDNLYGFYSW